jgi:gamma-glutamylcyclotransferase (GGCT)/AIG2-like uncharacterized protein YtfP
MNNKKTVLKKHRGHTPEEITRAFYGAQGNNVDLFVYGTLVHERYLQLLLNRKVESIPAKLFHYMRLTPSWNFPFIVKQKGAVTEGRILRNITKEELKILDDFEDEGELYFRRSVVVRVGDMRQRCKTYVGNISAINNNISSEMQFEDKFSFYVEKKIDSILGDVPANKPGLDRQVLHELMGSAVDSIIQSHFDGNYICNYIMIQALENAAPPSLVETLKKPELIPYAGNYMRLACQHIVFNHLVDKIRHQHPESVRVSHQYYQHGIAILLGFLFYNRRKNEINRAFNEMDMDKIVEGRGYRDYAKIAIDIADNVYDAYEMESLIDMIDRNWYSTPTPLGAELEFGNLGSKTIYAEPGDDPVYDSFYWFWDFDMLQRTWRLGGHVDSHRQITLAQKRHRGFLEYALGRYQIIGDLSRPLFDCPWAMSLLINEAVDFLDIKPHSLHISMELGGHHKHITDKQHKESDLVCLLLLGGDIRPDKNGNLREWRIANNELDTNFQKSLNFSDRKFHFSKADMPIEEAADVMEYKFMRLHKERNFDYETIIYALKGYQLHSHVRPVNIQKNADKELPEQIFLRKWANKPEAIDEKDIDKFVQKVQMGLMEEIHVEQMKSYIIKIGENLHKRLIKENNYIKNYLI